MTAQTDPYVRVYYRIIDDPKFETVFTDDRRLATWLRLLLTADATYPAPAPIPFGIHKATFQVLIDLELIDLMPGNRYRMHGLSAERERRSEQARRAANARHGQSGSTADASSNGLHSAPLRSEPIRSSPPAGTKKNGLKPIGELLPGVVEKLLS